MSNKPKNLRDLGGIVAKDGRRVKRGMLYRSGYLAHLTPESSEKFCKKLGLYATVDLRSPSELAEVSDVLPPSVRYIHIPPLNDEQNPSINRKNRLGILRKIMAKEGGAKRHLCDIYKTLVTSRESLLALGSFLRLLCESEGRPVLWHCTQGKDRTGLAAASVLMALGVSRKAIMKDYLRSNRSCFLKNAVIYPVVAIGTFSLPTAHSLNLLLTSRRYYLNTTFSEIDRVYGGTEGFLTLGLGLSPEELSTLKKIYLT